jgi:type VI secretion system protein VasD
LGAILMLATGCGSKINIPQLPQPTRVSLTVTVDPDANPDPRGTALPIVVRLFQVSAPGEFESADFFDLIEGSPTLAVEGYAVLDELEMAGGESRESVHELDGAARYVGVIAAYRQIDKARWLALMPLAANQLNALAVSVGRLQLDVSNITTP